MKRHSVLIFTLVIALFSTLYAQEDNSQEIFAQANTLYKAGSFEQAMKLYKQIPKKSPYTYYNLGNCAYKLEQYGFALLYWRKAETSWSFFNRDELIDNMTLLREKMRVKYAGTDKKRSPIAIAAIKIIAAVKWIYHISVIAFFAERSIYTGST